MQKDQSLDEDIRIAKEVARGDRLAMDTVYRAHAPKILSICRRYASGKEEALDLLHDGFLRIFDKIDTYKGQSALGIWIKRVVINHAINALRAKTKWEELAEEVPDLSDEEWEEEEQEDPITVRQLLNERNQCFRMARSRPCHKVEKAFCLLLALVSKVNWQLFCFMVICLPLRRIYGY